MAFKLINNPITQKRLSRFKENKRAYISFWILIIFYCISILSELIASSEPLYMKFNGKYYFPPFKYYSEDIFMENGRQTRPDYKKIQKDSKFASNPDNYMVFPIFPYGPYESIQPSSIVTSDDVKVIFSPMPMVASINISKDYIIQKSFSFGYVIDKDEKDIIGLSLTSFYQLSEGIRLAISRRFANLESDSSSYKIIGNNKKEMEISLSPFSPRSLPPKTVRLIFRETEAKKEKQILTFNKGLNNISKSELWDLLSDENRNIILDYVEKRFIGVVDNNIINIKNRFYTLSFIKEEVTYPYPPSGVHFMGIDSTGRDVFARILYGFRTSLTFGIMLVLFSMGIGIVIGAIQGYYGGIIDITCQRLIEIWGALPFFYIMILMGSIYGQSLILLLFLYGLFNWIGISYYMRGEFLRLRKQPFVEAAKCMGISSTKIIIKYILPNAIVPVVTFFPFSLVGAIASLAALDYLGFGLPAPTPSWGELLFEAQQFRWAWWLILYPSLALFIVMILGIFLGEGIRSAYDPKKYTRLN
ncbi:MAG: ABC transporter permease [Desulfobacterales bacterium]|nr:ABC transporter permease [Desulfobacterales bacterium]